jgi:hypothetical protein
MTDNHSTDQNNNNDDDDDEKNVTDNSDEQIGSYEDGITESASIGKHRRTLINKNDLNRL